MTINTSDQIESNDSIKNIAEAKSRIIEYLQLRIAELGNSIAGENPDEQNNYSADYYANRDQRDILNEFLDIVKSVSGSDKGLDSVESFIQAICGEVQNFPKENYGQFIKFIEDTFKIKVKPLSGPPIYYTAWLNHYSGKYGVTPEEVQKVLPYELFQKFEQSNDTAARIRLMMDNFDQAE